jgi:hypothetical protein
MRDTTRDRRRKLWHAQGSSKSVFPGPVLRVTFAIRCIYIFLSFVVKQLGKPFAVEIRL